MKTKVNNWINQLKNKLRIRANKKIQTEDSKVEVKKNYSKPGYRFPGASTESFMFKSKNGSSMHLNQAKHFYARYERRSYSSGNVFYIKQELISFQ